MKLELNRWEIRRLIQALRLAEDYQESSIGSWKNNLKKSNGVYVECFSWKDKEAIKDIFRWRKDIEAFEKIRSKLMDRILRRVKI